MSGELLSSSQFFLVILSYILHIQNTYIYIYISMVIYKNI